MESSIDFTRLLLIATVRSCAGARLTGCPGIQKFTPKDVARFVSDDLVSVDNTIKQMVEQFGFDLHYTPGKGIVGLKSAKKALGTDQDKKIVESAMLLASTMVKAKSIPGVIWFSDWGGSAILTRALQILSHEKSVKLESHRIVLHRPTTNSSLAIKLANELKIGITEKRSGFRPSEFIGNHLHSDLNFKATVKTSAFGLSAAGADFGVAGLSLTTSGVVGFAGALYFVGTTLVAGTKTLSPKKYK